MLSSLQAHARVNRNGRGRLFAARLMITTGSVGGNQEFRGWPSAVKTRWAGGHFCMWPGEHVSGEYVAVEPFLGGDVLKTCAGNFEVLVLGCQTKFSLDSERMK